MDENGLKRAKIVFLEQKYLFFLQYLPYSGNIVGGNNFAYPSPFTEKIRKIVIERHPALTREIKSVINSSHFYTLCWTKVERENYISIYVSQYRQLGHIESFFFFIARPGSYCKKMFDF